jgi:putative membrane protein
MMSNWTGWSGFGIGAGWPFMIFFWGVVVIVLVAAVRWLISNDSGRRAAGANRALDTLRERYARGEIDREEYEQKKRDLA